MVGGWGVREGVGGVVRCYRKAVVRCISLLHLGKVELRLLEGSSNLSKLPRSNMSPYRI